MKTRLALAAIVVALACAAPAAAHEYSGPNGNDHPAYAGYGCGGHYMSPFTGHQWFDCWAGQEAVHWSSACNGTCRIGEVYRLYTHWVDGWNLSYVSWEFVDLRWG